MNYSILQCILQCINNTISTFVARHFQRIPHAEMEQLQEIVFRHIKALDEKFLATFVEASNEVGI